MRGDKFVEILKTKVKILEVTRQADDQITVLVDRNDLPLAVKTLYYEQPHLLSRQSLPC